MNGARNAILFCGMLLFCVFGISLLGGAEEDIPAALVCDDALKVQGVEALLDKQEEAPRRWFVLVGLVNVYPRLEREQLIKDILDPVIQTMAPGYRGTKTFTDMRDDHLLWPPQISIGRILSKRFALSIHGGYSAGTVHTDKRNPSILFGLPLYTDVKIRRYATYIGLDLDYYPWGMVKQRDYANWQDRLRGTRPTLGIRHTWTWAGFDADVRLGLWPVKEALKVKLRDSWTLPNITLVGGIDIPLNKRSVLILNAGYSFFWKEKRDFAGPAVTIGWRYMF